MLVEIESQMRKNFLFAVGSLMAIGLPIVKILDLCVEEYTAECSGADGVRNKEIISRHTLVDISSSGTNYPLLEAKKKDFLERVKVMRKLVEETYDFQKAYVEAFKDIAFPEELILFRGDTEVRDVLSFLCFRENRML